MPPRGLAADPAFVILINTFEGLAGKTTMLAKFAMMLIVLFPPGAPRERG